MFRAIIIGVMLLCLCGVATATDVSGPVSGTWTATNSPYNVVGNIYIASYDTLIIESGVRVVFQGYYSFGCDGTLRAVGTMQDSILFTANIPLIPWQGISFSGSTSIEYCIFEWAKSTYANGFVFYIQDTLSLSLTNSTIRYCQTESYSWGLMHINETHNFSLSNNQILLNQIYGSSTNYLIWCENSDGLFSDNTIVENTVSGTFSRLFRINAADLTIMNNKITNNSVSGGGSFPGNIICAINNAVLIMKNNLIAENSGGNSVGLNANGWNMIAQLENNTIINQYDDCLYIEGASLLGVNNIFGGTTSPISIQNYPVIALSYCNIQGGYSGLGNINSDPLFIQGPLGEYYLSQIVAGQPNQSPCVNTGNPFSSMITGTTRTDQVQDAGIIDMGFHYTLSPPPPPPFEVNITPINPPIIIPAQGGWFTYNINVHNYGDSTQTLNVWNRLKLPNGTISDPIWGPITRFLPANANPTRTLMQTIAGSYPAGNYLYISYVGTYPWVISDSSYFPFTKTALSDGGEWVEETTCSGDFFDEFADANVGAQHAAPLPAKLTILGISPNPFNPTTVASYQLQVASHVSFKVYDTAGRLVATLVDGWREAGSHEVTFDASGLPSGVYLARLQAGDFSQTQKMVLLK